MLASTVQFSTTTRTSNPPTTPAADRPNDRTRETHPSPRPPENKPGGPGAGSSSQDPTVRSPAPPHVGEPEMFVVSTFSRATPTRRPPRPETSPRTRGAKLSGPSTTTGRCTEHTSMDTRTVAVFGEAP